MISGCGDLRNKNRSVSQRVNESTGKRINDSMLEQHRNDRVRYEQQVENARSYVLPFVEQTMPVTAGMRVLEVGCGEGGVLLPFLEKGALGTGVDLDPPRIDLANEYLAQEVAEGRVSFLLKNVYDDDFVQEYAGAFQLIILKDVIEHIPNQEAFIPHLARFLAPGGQIFFGFPPWLMPFGGHQQIATGSMASKMPWYHILPRPVYKGLLKMMGEKPGTIAALMEVVDTQITIERFERIIRKSNLQVLKQEHFLINPIYRYKFGLKPRKQTKLITAIPYLRDFLTTCVYYTVGKQAS